jgi:hypothetical protein
VEEHDFRLSPERDRDSEGRPSGVSRFVSEV